MMVAPMALAVSAYSAKYSTVAGYIVRPPIVSGKPALGIAEKMAVGRGLLHHLQNARDMPRPGAAIDADHVRARFMQLARHIPRQMPRQSAILMPEGHLADHGQFRRDLFSDFQRQQRLGQIGKRFEQDPSAPACASAKICSA